MGRPRGEPSAVLSAVAAALSVLYIVLVPLHLAVLSGAARSTVAAVDVLSALALAAIAFSQRRRAGFVSSGLVMVVAGIPLANSLAHVLITGDMRQTTVLMLVVVAIGAGVIDGGAAFALIASGLIGWLAVVLLQRGPGVSAATDVVHYGSQLGMAVVLAGVMHAIRRSRDPAQPRSGDREVPGQLPDRLRRLPRRHRAVR